MEAKCAISGCYNAAAVSHGLNLEGNSAAKGTFNNHNLQFDIYYSCGCMPMPKELTKPSDEEIKALT